MGRFKGFGGSGLRLIIGFMSGFEVAKKNATGHACRSGSVVRAACDSARIASMITMVT